MSNTPTRRAQPALRHYAENDHAMRIVIALGGNALLKRGEAPTIEVQRHNARRAATSIARIAAGNELILTHGNGPQIGLLALQGSAATAPLPLDVLNAQTDGMIGYLLEQELMNALGGCRIVTVLTQIEVDAADPGFSNPTKFIGPVYDRDESQRVAAARGWTMARDGAQWRRVVPSPEPRGILEIAAIRTLVAAGLTTICAGGGGIPVQRRGDGRYEGIDCVVDKDYTSALLARQLDADCLLMLTDVAAVYTGFGTAAAQPLRHATAAQLATLEFPAGSMGPKVEAACRFVREGGARACIGSLDEVPEILAGRAGTSVSACMGD
jgi:carbamate kinase